MKPAAVGLLLLLGVPLLVAGQQPGSAKLPLVITDPQAVEEWGRALHDGPLDPKLPSDTQFLLSLTESEMVGRFRFRQRCALCHAPQADFAAATWGPILTQKHVMGREASVRQRIMEGSPGMPAFKYALDPLTIDLIIAYLKKVERFP